MKYITTHISLIRMLARTNLATENESYILLMMLAIFEQT